MTNDANIRLECLKPAERWAQPTGEEVREVLRLAGFSGSKAAKALGLMAVGIANIIGTFLAGQSARIVQKRVSLSLIYTVVVVLAVNALFWWNGRAG